MFNPTLRIIDANRNRAGEGLRVCEEYARFVLDNPPLTETVKRLRHSLRVAVDTLVADLPSTESLLAHRDTLGDVGTTINITSESNRADTVDVARASTKRVQESLRALEEYGKTISPAAAQQFETLRYAFYDLETRLFIATDWRKKLAAARLYVLVTESLASTDALTATREAVAGGADIIQLREKNLEDGALLERASALVEICRQAGVLFLLNDRPHVAALANADGIHTGWGDLPIHLARRVQGAERIVGRSTSSLEYLSRATEEGADYVGVGPVYPTNTKQHREAVGLTYVRQVVERATLPYFCIGSINRETLAGVLDTGARAVAVCTAIIGAKDIAKETAWFKEQLLGTVAQTNS